MASRRMNEAAAFLEDKKGVLTQSANHLRLVDFEGQQDLMEWTGTSIRLAAQELGKKSHQLGKVPYLIARADEPEIAKLCATQLQSIPEERLDSQLRELRDTCLVHLQVVWKRPSFKLCLLFGN